jgi:hypothetical protein
VNRVLTRAVARAVTLPEVTSELPPVVRAVRLWPLGRYVLWAVAMFAVCAVAVSVRLDVQQARRDLDRLERAEREALVLNERLRLEIEARHRAVSVAAAAEAVGLTDDVRVVVVRDDAPVAVAEVR